MTEKIILFPPPKKYRALPCQKCGRFSRVLEAYESREPYYGEPSLWAKYECTKCGIRKDSF